MARFKTPEQSTQNTAQTAVTPQKVGRHAAGATHPANATNIARAPHSAQGTYNATRRPVDLPSAPSPSATGAFQVVSQSTATSAKRMRSYHGKGNVKQKPSKAPKGVILGIVIAAVIVAILLFVLISGLFGSSSSQVASNTEAATTTVKSEAALDEGIEYHGYTYKISQIEGGWALVSTNGAQDNILYSFAGTPVSLLFYEGRFIAVENLADGTWDAISYMAMDGATATQILAADGSVVGGSATIQSAAIDGSNLVCTDTTGAQIAVALG